MTPPVGFRPFIRDMGYVFPSHALEKNQSPFATTEYHSWDHSAPGGVNLEKPHADIFGNQNGSLLFLLVSYGFQMTVRERGHEDGVLIGSCVRNVATARGRSSRTYQFPAVANLGSKRQTRKADLQEIGRPFGAEVRTWGFKPQNDRTELAPWLHNHAGVLGAVQNRPDGSIRPRPARWRAGASAAWRGGHTAADRPNRTDRLTQARARPTRRPLVPRCAGMVAAVTRGRPCRRRSPCRARWRTVRRCCSGSHAVDRIRTW